MGIDEWRVLETGWGERRVERRLLRRRLGLDRTEEDGRRHRHPRQPQGAETLLRPQQQRVARRYALESSRRADSAGRRGLDREMASPLKRRDLGAISARSRRDLGLDLDGLAAVKCQQRGGRLDQASAPAPGGEAAAPPPAPPRSGWRGSGLFAAPFARHEDEGRVRRDLAVVDAEPDQRLARVRLVRHLKGEVATLPPLVRRSFRVIHTGGAVINADSP